MLSKREIERYSRQIILKDVGSDGQLALKAARVLIFGCGGLGAPAALYLAAAGVGEIGLIDKDNLDLSNLQRQIIYSEDEINQPKTALARSRLNSLNSDVVVKSYQLEPDLPSLKSVVQNYDCVIDASDNIGTKLLLNKVCCELKVPLIFGAVRGFSAQMSVFLYKGGACVSCWLGTSNLDDSSDCEMAGVLGPICGVIGTMQALEAIKFYLNISTISGYLLIFEGLNAEMTKIRLKKNQHCVVCNG